MRKGGEREGRVQRVRGRRGEKKTREEELREGIGREREKGETEKRAK